MPSPYLLCVTHALSISPMCATCPVHISYVCHMPCPYLPCVPHALSISPMCATCPVHISHVCHMPCPYLLCVPHALSISPVCATCSVYISYMCHMPCPYLLCVPRALSISPMCATCPVHISCVCHMPCPYHPSWFHHPNSVLKSKNLKYSNLASLHSGYLYIALKIITLSTQCYLKTLLKLLITFSLLSSSHPDMAVTCLFSVRIQLNLRFLQQSL